MIRCAEMQPEVLDKNGAVISRHHRTAWHPSASASHSRLCRSPGISITDLLDFDREIIGTTAVSLQFHQHASSWYCGELQICTHCFNTHLVHITWRFATSTKTVVGYYRCSMDTADDDWYCLQLSKLAEHATINAIAWHIESERTMEVKWLWARSSWWFQEGCLSHVRWYVSD